VEFVTFRCGRAFRKAFRLPRWKRRKGRNRRMHQGPAAGLLRPQKKCVTFTVYDRLKSSRGAHAGPAIIEEKEATIVIGEDARARWMNTGSCVD